jgi:hypothetical protein
MSTSKGNYLYRGNVQIHLQGPHALLPIRSNRDDHIICFIGSRRSKLIIRDFRHEPVHAANRTPAGIDGSQFAEAFNQPAYAEVSLAEKEPEKVEINLHTAKKEEDFPVLWLGVKNDLLMPMLDIEWEIVRPINEEKVAFTAMIRFEK